MNAAGALPPVRGSAEHGKAELRAAMRAARRSLPDRAERSGHLVRRLQALSVVRSASRVMVYKAIPGEPDLARFVDWCREHGVDVLTPEHGPEPTWPDVVIVPGTAYTAAGLRLGQGGGWFDRFLPGIRSDAVSLGVCFDVQLLADVPVEPHDMAVDAVVTETAVWWST